MRALEIQAKIRLRLARHGLTLWRNNVAQGWVGELFERGRSLVTLRYPRPLHAGLCAGSSDLIGFHSILVTPEMVGARIAIFCAVEVKSPLGRVSEAQKNFLAHVNQCGGIGIVARSEDDAIRGVSEWKPVNERIGH